MRTSVVWGLRLEAFERGRLFPYQWNRVDAKGGRPNPMQRSCEEEDLTEWTACVTQNRSVQIGFPLAEYRRPRSGWIFVERASEARSDHMNVIAVDLESGDTVWKQGGNLRTGRGNVRHFGEFALVTMLAKHAAEFSDGQILAIPNHLQPGPACSMSADPPDDPTRVSTHSTLTFWWWHNDNVISKVQLTTYGYNQPAGDLARKLLDIAQSEIISESREITKPDPTPSTDARLMQIVDELWESSARQQGGGPRKGQLDRAASDDRESDRK